MLAQKISIYGRLKPVHDAIKIYLDGIETGGYSVNYSTGGVIFTKHQMKDAIITAKS
ncbi:MAG: hypothetical protein ACR5K2_05155 [Wolbachia sp.]